MADLRIRDRNLKSLHEALCLAQLKLGSDSYKVKLLGKLLAEVERHRPLGPNGKHGQLHTRTCGCEDKPGWFKRLKRHARRRNGGSRG